MIVAPPGLLAIFSTEHADKRVRPFLDDLDETWPEVGTLPVLLLDDDLRPIVLRPFAQEFEPAALMLGYVGMVRDRDSMPAAVEADVAPAVAA